MRIKVVKWILFAFAFLPPLAAADKFAVLSPSGETRLDWVVDEQEGFKISVSEQGAVLGEIPFVGEDCRRDNLGIANFPDRSFLWVSERFCVASTRDGLGIIDTSERKWVCNIAAKWACANLRHTWTLVRFESGDIRQNPDQLEVYRFDSDGFQMEVAKFDLRGRVVSPLFGHRYLPHVAFFLKRANGTVCLEVIDAETGKPLAEKAAPRHLLSKTEVWKDAAKKEGAARNRALMNWIDSATKYGPFSGAR